MWTTRWGKVTLLCGWLAAPLAGAMELEELPTDARADVEDAYTEGAPDEMGRLVDPDTFFPGDTEEPLDSPRLRYAEPLSCPAVPGGRVWVADTEECGEAECIRTTTVWIGSWTVEDAELEVRCETDRVVLSTQDWQWVLEPDAQGAMDVAEATPAEPETAPAELAAPASET
ncbi:hypothetical protein HPC49_07350 [Pyxidicoccus fallax]|uniref:Lipoprotein n=1 Tax=Pyxidicoccus fallax TaxID=394095 RepID=A0A848L911_9BACT|nr:hypothetical protein [Pyxidicoccus fallax]NMO15046.1 hypothetical protein [Pyxidicoccus fallax]NPC78068.1 hypothetical protein [Pyxidicoccus fallax]